jgi:ubiquinone/menaquinone biosynthesis C-methylase UbiE
VAIEWREGSAEQLPFPESSFDLVLCQFALMFFADKATALAETRRVAAGNGRVFVSAWQGLDRHPFYLTLHNVIQQRLGISALQDIFALGSTDELRALVMGAGFRRVEVEPRSMTARFPNPDARQAVVAAISADMASPLKEVTHDDHVVIQFHAYIVKAWP